MAACTIYASSLIRGTLHQCKANYYKTQPKRLYILNVHEYRISKVNPTKVYEPGPAKRGFQTYEKSEAPDQPAHPHSKT